jgi:hypothetical protein
MLMNRLYRTVGTALLALSTALAATLAAPLAMAATQSAPSPPGQLCVNNQCVTTPIPTPPPTTGSGQIKWNPGHYMASYGIVRGGGGSSGFVNGEMDDLNNLDFMLGYRMLITWSAIETSKGNYDFSVIDAALARLKTQYNKPKRLVVMLVWYSPSPWSSGDDSVIPDYILNDPSYGASPVAGSYGWWGRNSGGASTGMNAPAVYYPPVMDRLVALVQALGQHLDADPNFEAFFIQENSAIVQAAAGFGNNDPHYSDAVWLAQSERLLSASTAAFPHTSVIMANAYFANGQSAVALEQWMAKNRIAAGTADSFGQSGIVANHYNGMSDGLKAYLGVNTANGGTTDLRPAMTAMFDVESGDMTTTYLHKWGGPFSPQDIVTALNTTYKASHAFWTRMVGNTPAAAQWVNVAAVCAANPLLRTAYPANYP